MKHALLTALIAAALAGCIENRNDSPLRLLGSFEVDNECTPVGLNPRGEGTLDVAGARLLGDAAALNLKYWTKFRVLNEMTDAPVRMGDQQLASKERNSITVDKMILSYQSTPNLNLRPEEVAKSLTLTPAPSSPGEDHNFNILGPVAAQALLDNVVTGDTVVLTVTVQLSGVLNSGGTVLSNLRDYTIQVVDSGLQCRLGETLERNGPCFGVGGQDNFPVSCVTPDAGTEP